MNAILAALLILGAQEQKPILRAVDLNVGESETVELSDGTSARVKVLKLDESRDTLRGAVRYAYVEVEVNDATITLSSANYQLPVTVGGVQIDCPITKGYLKNASVDVWGLVKDVRLRLWPKGSPWVRPGTFLYPVKQRWFANHTWMANEPIDAGSDLLNRKIYYHWGLDIGGSEGLVNVVAATDGTVVSVGDTRIDDIPNPLVGPRYDVVYIKDDRGWYYRYSHLKTIETAIRLGRRVRMGQKVGTIGKEGGSGGWTHLHIDVSAMMPSGKWGNHDGYAFIWEAYQRQFAPRIIANARPRALTEVGQSVRLDATRSWSATEIVRYDWTFSDGTTAQGPTPTRTYDTPGVYSEVLKVTDAEGRVAYDFGMVMALDKETPEPIPPRVHVTHHPTFGIQAGDSVTFKARSFETTDGHEIWNFGDGTPPVTSRSDGNVDQHATEGYSILTHRFSKPGHYLVRVQRTDKHKQKGMAHVRVRVGPPRRVRFVNPDNSFVNAVIVGGHALAHTGQILPVDARDRMRGKGKVNTQIRMTLENLGSALAAGGADFRSIVKLNLYAKDDEAAETLMEAIGRRFKGRRKPAVSLTVGAQPHADAVVSMDAVAIADRDWTPGVAGVELRRSRALPEGAAHVAVLPPGEQVYISGQAGHGKLREATRGTLKSLQKTLDFLGVGRHHVVQVKAFLQPMEEAETVRQEIIGFFGEGKVPPLVFVDWKSSETVPIEIELVAWSGRGGETPGGRLEYLTPQGVKASPVYTRVVRVADLDTIYISGLHGSGGDEQQVREVYKTMAVLLRKCGSDLKHLVKGTYYVTDEAISGTFGKLRTEIYDPQRPPAASKARVDSVGLKGKRITVDMIAVMPPGGSAMKKHSRP